jgi:hypothetical protein
MSDTPPVDSPKRRFRIAFSFAGEKRDFVAEVAAILAQRFGKRILYDKFHEAEFSRARLGRYLPKLYHDESDLVVVVNCPDYGEKEWCGLEWDAIFDLLKKRREADVMLCRFNSATVEGLYSDAGYIELDHKTPAEVATLILERLALNEDNKAPSSSPVVPEAESLRKPDRTDWPEAPPQLSWPMADHSGAREAFASLLTRAVPWRFLPIRGSSEIGKSHITRQMLANALTIPNIACGRFDFKGTTGMDSEVSAFAQFLDVAVPAPGPRLQERLGHILAGLKQRSHPALLIFDTYEMAGETEDWIERHLLPNLIRETWLRVVVAGQKVPDATGTWACPTLQLLPPPPRDWLDYGRQHRGDLTLADVEIACRLASDKASLLAAMLGPAK